MIVSVSTLGISRYYRLAMETLNWTGQPVVVAAARRGPSRVRSWKVRVGKATNAAVTARARTRERKIAADVEDAAREQRRTAAAAEVHRARAVIDAARERAALAVAAARAVERDEVAAAEKLLNAGVRRLSDERLTVAQVADLVGLPAPVVRRILRAPSTTDHDPPDGPATG